MTFSLGERLFLIWGQHPGYLREMQMEWRMVLSAVAWTSVVGLAVAGTMAGVGGLTVWAIVVGQVAMVVTGWLIGESVLRKLHAEMLAENREMSDRAVERVASRIAQELRGDASVSSLR